MFIRAQARLDSLWVVSRHVLALSTVYRVVYINEKGGLRYAILSCADGLILGYVVLDAC